ncbi:MAG: Type 1 glutamine amidotransferase-like domain-containing protein [Planctomycetes bacterium]|nr:Type 1 glutamine amidotransferase-like domain-containing protein [Planctomycetota bacterium]
MNRVEVSKRIWCLFGLCIASLNAYGQYTPNAPEPHAPIAGALFLHGGGELTQEVRELFVNVSGGDRASLLVVSNSDTEGEPFSKELGLWEKIPRARLKRMHVASRDQADSDEFLEAIDSSNGIWFSGYQKETLIDHYSDSRAGRKLHECLQRGGAIGGENVGSTFAHLQLDESSRLSPGLGFLPGVLIHQKGSESDPARRIESALESHPDHVGIEVEPTYCLVVSGRRLGGLGPSAFRIHLAKSTHRPARVMVSKPERTLDLIALQRAAMERKMSEFPPKESRQPKLDAGKLLIVGGGLLPNEVLQQFIECAGGNSSRIVYIPCSESKSIDEEPDFVAVLRKASGAEVRWIHTKDRLKANENNFCEPLKDATGVWFGGGRQWNLVDSYQNTRTHRLIEMVLERGGVVGGSSAGASIQGEYMPRGDPLGNQVMMAEGYERGLGLLRGVAIDQHFSQRKRHGDMMDLKKAYPQYLGIGVDEGTALLVEGSIGRVVGRGKVSFFGEPIESKNLSDYVEITSGKSYDLVGRKVLDQTP